MSERILAYHYIPPKFVDTVLADGRIKTALEHTNPYKFRDYCEDSIKDLVERMVDRNSDVVMRNVATLFYFVNKEVESVGEWQRDEGIEPVEGETKFYCWDFLAGDIEGVFLGLDNFPHWADVPNGLVFDAEELVRRGARLRMGDLLPRYEEAVRRVMTEDLEDYEFIETLEEALQDVKTKGEFQGDAAIRKMRKGEWRGVDESPELVWPGSLPVEWAIEVWKDGRELDG